MIVAKTFKFVKDSNGTVLLQNIQDNSVVASFEPSMSLYRESGDDNRFRIASSKGEDGFLINYRSIDCDSCEPIIFEDNVNAFLEELSKKFFFEKQVDGNAQVQDVRVSNFPAASSFFKIYECPQYRGNVYGFTSSNQSKKYIVQSVFWLSSTTQINIWSPNHFNNEDGFNTMMVDSAESRLIPTDTTFHMNGMYLKITSTFNFWGGRYHLLRLYQDARTNEVYLMANQSIAVTTYIPFDFSTLKAVDGGFSIECLPLNLKIEVRNKFF